MGGGQSFVPIFTSWSVVHYTFIPHLHKFLNIISNLPKTMLNFLLANLPKWWKRALHNAVWKHKGATVTEYRPAGVFRNLTQLYQFPRRPVSVWIKCFCEKRETRFLNYHHHRKENHWKGTGENMSRPCVSPKCEMYKRSSCCYLLAWEVELSLNSYWTKRWLF